MTQKETVDSAMEQGHMVQVLLEHCDNMKRQETRLRLASALLLAAFFALLVWIQFNQQKTDVFPGARVEALTADEETPRRFSSYFKTDPNKNVCPQEQRTEQLIGLHWCQRSDGLDYQHFNLTDTSVLRVLTKGLYLINLRMSYRIVHEKCHNDKPKLDIKVTQQHSNYMIERDVITAVESIQCIQYWRQSVTLNRVIMLEDDTALRVKINSKACQYIDWHVNNHLDITYLYL